MTRKIQLGILFGGRSAEHEVSLQSARNIIEALDKDKYDLTLIGIDKQGGWYLNETSRFLLEAQQPALLKLNEAGPALALVPGAEGHQLVRTGDMSSLPALDVAFPVLHGTYGEDGAVQGLLKMAGIPCVGSGILGSAVGMDKDVMKRLLREAGIPTPRFCVLHAAQREQIQLEAVLEALGGFPLFVKPANLGSSVGIHKVKSAADWEPALADAFSFDTKLVIEEGLICREIECSVLGNQQPRASLPGEVIVQAEFYSYEAKYISEDAARLEIPARLPEAQIAEIQALAVQTFRVLNCEGLARVDFFLTPEGQVYVNEVNTLPGFTRISMYPKLWEASGLSYRELLDQLIALALERAAQERKLRTSYLDS
ncbi:D-alanine--D-alanine ligase [bacterium (Candidatus Blackallbacteria) CG17_big_fil_post_rev_8_21_14_2_50_48_46]|uniref:D-alanine--D-alanine ligase n=1 Tax=bacterium (Candidatus Blackallbacteria) CG17_big_fil_post_rev_8_21_14_2_50_48_46 TaxID=2014261 RepID=A0A2M7G0Y9_9BACT|nr:MAG: D-alanine--D-alanine ligase [bacterium (Candidatus Blackallbacteria) CG18_big_fil_WC_8_21_14_2_50_49_26]PIW15371.1 MAG: D-alanine--D-alanine ligase [bacterium (Candidatus Blackallbacteria) CG17_big_fil_post_rev_8_21_14_2_50_48_46]PIW49768.1 MAG: D-alanine--D-alanine ligase [bacterium (Candidatus Blackallbacteria) CG13_big_fil_rev_8_21_14_2_50_49_14]